MKDKVTSKQMVHASTGFIISTSLLTKPLYVFAKNDSWIAVIAGFVVAAFIYLIYTAVAHRFPDKTIIEINDVIYGRVIGKIISVLYVYFFLTIVCLDTNIFSGFVKAFILQNTPMALIIFLFLFVCAWAVRKGPVNLMKYGALIVYVSIFLVLLNTVMLYKNVDFKNLLPAFNLPVSAYIVGTHSVALIPFCDAFMLIMFKPYMQNPKDFGKSIAKGLAIGAAFLLFVVIRDTAVLGHITAKEAFPTYATIRLIDVGDIITRMEIIYMSVLIALMFYKVALLFYATVSGAQRLLKLGSYQPFVTIAGALLLLYSLNIVRSSGEHIGWLLDGSGYIHHTFFLVVLPLLTLLVAVCRGFFKSDNHSAANTLESGGNQP